MTTPVHPTGRPGTRLAISPRGDGDRRTYRQFIGRVPWETSRTLPNGIRGHSNGHVRLHFRCLHSPWTMHPICTTAELGGLSWAGLTARACTAADALGSKIQKQLPEPNVMSNNRATHSIIISYTPTKTKQFIVVNRARRCAMDRWSRAAQPSLRSSAAPSLSPPPSPLSRMLQDGKDSKMLHGVHDI